MLISRQIAVAVLFVLVANAVTGCVSRHPSDVVSRIERLERRLAALEKETGVLPTAAEGKDLRASFHGKTLEDSHGSKKSSSAPSNRGAQITKAIYQAEAGNLPKLLSKVRITPMKGKNALSGMRLFAIRAGKPVPKSRSQNADVVIGSDQGKIDSLKDFQDLFPYPRRNLDVSTIEVLRGKKRIQLPYHVE